MFLSPKNRFLWWIRTKWTKNVLGINKDTFSSRQWEQNTGNQCERSQKTRNFPANVGHSNGRARLKRDGTRAETRFGLSAQRTSPFKLPGGGAVQATTGSRGVRISGSNGSNAGYTMFWGRVQDYWLPTPLACFPFTSPTVRHSVLSGFNWDILPITPSFCEISENNVRK